MSAQPHAFLHQPPSSQTREYLAAQSIAFLKTKEAFGGLSNMAAGYPLQVNGIAIRSSEALYQACRFPHLPEVQQRIISQISPMTAKMVSKPFRSQSRADWEQIKVNVMRWCLRVKLAQNRATFGALLLETGDLAIVEKSFKDSYWGAKPSADGSVLVGMNVLGRLLMELREELRSGEFDQREFIQPLKVADFCLYGQWIAPIAVGSESVNVKKSVSMESLSLPMEQDVVEPVVSTPSLVAGLKPYVEYKETGIAWIKRIPAHWQVLPNRALFYEVRDKNHPKEQLLSVTINKGIIKQSALIQETSKKDSSNKNKAAYKLVQPDDIAYNKMRAWQGAIGVSNYRGIISPAYIVMRLREKNNPYYFHYLFRTPSYNKEVERWSYGITSDQWNLRPEHFKMIYAPLPLIEEQNNIVQFLDYANHKIDQYIRAKKKLIKLLNEQKQVIIHKAVTRGLNPQVKLKDSGIEWLGGIPEHWECWQINRFAKVGNGSTPSRANINYWRGGNIAWLNSSHVNKGIITESDQFITNLALKECHLSLVPEESLLIAITGQGKTRGMAAILKIKSTINQHLAFITPKNNFIEIEYLHFIMLAAYQTLRQLSDNTGSTKGALTCYQLKHFKIAITRDAVEQKNIIQYIKNNTATIEKSILATEQEIQLLQEYRTRLISDVVTGQLDVQTAAQQLPPLNILNPELINTLDDAEDLTDDEAELIPEDQADGDGYQ